MRFLIRTLTLLFSLWAPLLLACTTAIVSGKATPDGRPLLLKHRDSGFYQNKIMHFNDGKYKYVGVVNSADRTGKEIWAGYNSAGFAIMNSASYNLNKDDTVVGALDEVAVALLAFPQRLFGAAVLLALAVNLHNPENAV